MADVSILHANGHEQLPSRMADVLYLLDIECDVVDASSSPIPVNLSIIHIPSGLDWHGLEGLARSIPDAESRFVVTTGRPDRHIIPEAVKGFPQVDLSSPNGQPTAAGWTSLLSATGIVFDRPFLQDIPRLVEDFSTSRLKQPILAWARENEDDAVAANMLQLNQNDLLSDYLDKLAGAMGFGGDGEKAALAAATTTGRKRPLVAIFGVGALALLLAGIFFIRPMFSGTDGATEDSAAQTATLENTAGPETYQQSTELSDVVIAPAPAPETITSDGVQSQVNEASVAAEPAKALDTKDESNPDAAASEETIEPIEIDNQPLETVAASVSEPIEEEIRPLPSRPASSFEYPDLETLRDNLRNGGQGPLMIVLPAGQFTMGSPSSERGHVKNEAPQIGVVFSQPVAISRYEVTRAELSSFFDAHPGAIDEAMGCSVYRDKKWRLDSGASFQTTGYRQAADHPAACVDWELANAYAAWMSEQTGENYRLPTEAEWEYAARAGTQTPFFFGDDADEGCGHMNGADEFALSLMPELLNAYCSDATAYTAPVGQFQPNAFGLHDMHGNVWELTIDDWHEDHTSARKNGGPRERRITSKRVIRGGSWISYPLYLRSANRANIDKNVRRADVGFRLVREISPQSEAQ